MNAARERAAEPTAAVAVDEVDAAYLESLIGYNARRAALAMIGAFLPGMAAFDLRPVDFSVLSLVLHNPGITSRQLCATLGILPPNLVGLVGTLERRGLVLRQPHPTDRRAMGLHLTAPGRALMRKAERTAAGIEAAVASRLSPAEARTLIRLLRKVYLDR
ncbi:MarR family transcriptional regulator [Ramlibacter sp. RBP-2]|uniref:MarR family transcriptional regulator n=1 Tax=Ramlibacter lithotrophicus TaxID=2606681 RepID=A0A7X6I5C7_9BURK|nr:MarR family transcriptional regulator [Ramlibacter lithotrophicus]NKE65181.1 MarR family transcriptional regulator [Ramlibacter lithotrophicus]